MFSTRLRRGVDAAHNQILDRSAVQVIRPLYLLIQLVLLSAFCLPLQAQALKLVVADPYIELHSGPGRGYPVQYVVPKGEVIEVERERTDWIKIRYQPRKDTSGHEGWARRDAVAATLTREGEAIAFAGGSLEDFAERTWEVGILGGEFDGTSMNSVYQGVHFTRNYSVEFWLEEVLGNFSNSRLAGLDLVHQPFPEWRVSPFLALGTGYIVTKPKATLVDAEDRRDEIMHAGFGVRAYVTRHFIVRAEYKTYVILTSRDENEEPEAWKIGFSIFY